jgi:hypothetical protein
MLTSPQIGSKLVLQKPSTSEESVGTAAGSFSFAGAELVLKRVSERGHGIQEKSVTGQEAGGSVHTT